MRATEVRALEQPHACTFGTRCIGDYRFLGMVPRCHKILLLVEKQPVAHSRKINP